MMIHTNVLTVERINNAERKQNMKAAVIGLQYGDCGKGRVVGHFAKDYDWSVRFNGGPNAGHTVYDAEGNQHKFHHLPCGAAFGKKIALDAGMVINPETLSEEVALLKSKGFNPEIYISENVHMIRPEHVTSDANGSGIGSTKRGIAYVYADRALRKGERISNKKFAFKHIAYRGLPPIKENESAIYEGAQGIMLDIDYGDYPYVTSSSLIPHMAHKINKTIGVMKAYTSRVGDGPPHHPDMEEIRERGQEYGTTTGRPRKCTWNDIDQIKYAISVTQPDEIVVTKLDILDGMEDIGVYVGGEFYKIGNLDAYKAFLLEAFPQIKWFSESPDGEMTKVR